MDIMLYTSYTSAIDNNFDNIENNVFNNTNNTYQYGTFTWEEYPKLCFHSGLQNKKFHILSDNGIPE